MQSVINLEFDDTPPLPSTFAVWFAGVVCFRSGVFFVSTISFVRIVVFALTLRTLLSWVELIGSVCEQHNLFLATLTHCHIYLRVLTTYQTDIAVISKESQAVHTRHPSHKHASKQNIAFYLREHDIKINITHQEKSHNPIATLHGCLLAAATFTEIAALSRVASCSEMCSRYIGMSDVNNRPVVAPSTR